MSRFTVPESSRVVKIIHELEDNTVCPCCGAPLKATGLIVDLATNTAALRELRWKLSPKVAEFLYTLALATPRPVSLLDIGQAMWGAHAPFDRALNNRLAVYAWRVHKMLVKTELDIEHVSDRGYRICTKESLNPCP